MRRNERASRIIRVCNKDGLWRLLSSLLNDVAKYPDRTVASYIVVDDPESKVAVIDFKKGVGLKRMYIIITVSCSKSEGTIRVKRM